MTAMRRITKALHHRPTRTSSKLLLIASSSWLRIILNFGVTIVLTPMLIQALGLPLFGVYMLIAVTMQVNNPLRAAVGKTLTRELTASLAADDPKRIRTVFTNGMCLAAIGASIAALVATVLVVTGPYFLKFPDGTRSLLVLAMICEAALIVEVLALFPFKNLYIATHRHLQENLHRTIDRLMDLFAALIAIFLLPRVWPGAFSTHHTFGAFVVLRVTLRTLHGIAKAIEISRLEPRARFDRSLVDRAVMKRLAATGGLAMGNQTARLGFYSSDPIVLNLFFGPVYNAIYQVINQLRAFTRMFGGNLTFGVDSVSADLHERGRAHTNQALLLTSMKVVFAVTSLCALYMGMFAGPLIEVWLGKRISTPHNLDALASVGLDYHAAILFAWQYVAILLPGVVLAETNVAAGNILYGMGHENKTAPALMGAAAIKIVLAVTALLVWKDPRAMAVATVLCQFALFGVYFPLLINRLMGVSLRRQFVQTFLRPLLALLPVAIIAFVIESQVSAWTIPLLGGMVLLMGGLWAPLAFALVFDKPERDRLLALAGPILRRIGLGRYVPDVEAPKLRKKARKQQRLMEEQAAIEDTPNSC